MNNKTGNYQGLTLVELMVALAITIMVLTFAVPSFTKLSQSNFRTTQVNNLVSGLQRARGKAIADNGSVSIRRNDSGWNAGWTIFVDSDSDGSLDEGEEIIKVTERSNPSFTISSTDFADSVTFDRTGNTTNSGIFQYCGNESDAATRTRYSRAIILNNIGHVRLSRDDSGNGIHEDQSGDDLSCG